MTAVRCGYTSAARSRNDSGEIGVKFASLRGRASSKKLAMRCLLWFAGESSPFPAGAESGRTTYGDPPELHPGTACARRRRRDRRPFRAVEEDGGQLLGPVPVPLGEIAFVHGQPVQAVLSLL